MNEATIVMILVLLVYNLATIRLLTFALSRIDVAEALSEKAPAPAVPGGAAGAPAEDVTSYSRIAGMIGAIVMATFFWSVGNVILYKAFVAPAEVATFVGSLSNFFLAGASFFLPYGANQLREALAPR